MNNDRLLNILRWVVTPIVLAIIAGYFQSRTNANKEQTRATYETLAPNVLELQGQVAVLTGRVEELARRPIFVCPEASKPTVPRTMKPRSTNFAPILGNGPRAQIRAFCTCGWGARGAAG